MRRVPQLEPARQVSDETRDLLLQDIGFNCVSGSGDCHACASGLSHAAAIARDVADYPLIELPPEVGRAPGSARDPGSACHATLSDLRREAACSHWWCMLWRRQKSIGSVVTSRMHFRVCTAASMSSNGTRSICSKWKAQHAVGGRLRRRKNHKLRLVALPAAPPSDSRSGNPSAQPLRSLQHLGAHCRSCTPAGTRGPPLPCLPPRSLVDRRFRLPVVTDRQTCRHRRTRSAADAPDSSNRAQPFPPSAAAGVARDCRSASSRGRST